MSNNSYKKILLLFSSNSLAQIIPLLFAPVLSRLFTPDEFGYLALFVAISTFLSSTATLRLELAITSAETKKEAFILFKLSLIFISTLVLVGYIILLLLYFFNVFNTLSSYDILAVSLTSWVIGIGIVMNFYSLRQVQYKMIAKAGVLRSLIQTGGQLSFGFLGLSKLGLVISYILSSLAFSLSFVKQIIIDYKYFGKTHLTEYKCTLKKNKDFPLYSVWSSLMNNFSLSSVVFFLSYLFKQNEVGLYSFGVKYLNAPLMIIGTSISSVFFEESSKLIGLELKNLFKKNLIMLTTTALIIFTPIFIYVEDFFPILFGNEWKSTGYIIKILTPLLVMKFISNPISFVLYSLKKQKIELCMQLIFLFLNVSVWCLSLTLHLNFEYSLKLYSFSLAAYYALSIGVYYLIIKRNARI